MSFCFLTDSIKKVTSQMKSRTRYGVNIFVLKLYR